MSAFRHILPLLALLPATISAVTFDCQHIRVEKQSFDLRALGGPRDVHWQTSTPPTISNTTFTVDICAPLTKDKDSSKPSSDQCSSGTRVCGIERDYREGSSFVTKVINIAGDYLHGGSPLDPEVTRLKNGVNHDDAKQEGLIVVLNGGKYPSEGKGEKQKAIIKFLCDKNVTGNEGFDVEQRMSDSTIFGAMSRREEKEGDDAGEGDGDGDETEPELPDLDAGKSLQFISYGLEDDTRVLRLEWKTSHACEDAIDDAPTSDKKGGWGFFTWFLIIVFLLAAAYIIFGSWLNYNRYGARGWDLIPHGDAIRDLPYIAKDWFVNIMDRFRGSGGSRGGYSAV